MRTYARHLRYRGQHRWPLGRQRIGRICPSRPGDVWRAIEAARSVAMTRPDRREQLADWLASAVRPLRATLRRAALVAGVTAVLLAMGPPAMIALVAGSALARGLIRGLS
jgi:hypothetical protein